MNSSAKFLPLDSNLLAGNQGAGNQGAGNQERRNGWASWGFSVALHLLLLSILWFLTDSIRQPAAEGPRPGLIVIATDSIDPEQQYLTDSKSPEAIAETESQSDSSLTPNQAPESTSELQQAFESLDQKSKTDNTSQSTQGPGLGNSSRMIEDANSMLQSPGTSSSEKAREMTAAELKRLAEEQALVASRLPKGEPTTISIFGSGQLTGRKFVFVIDQSDSMGDGGLGVIDGSKAELSRAVAELHDYHQFQIVGYNIRTTTMLHRKLLNATRKNKEGIAPFLDGMVASGGTEHLDGLMIALGFSPDIIVLMSDGGDPEMNDNQLQQVRRIAGEKTEIHALQFGVGAQKLDPNSKPNFMVKLAEQNRGTYRYIDVAKWQRNKE